MANNILPIGEYGMYLRKSRKDLEAEAHGEGETLRRHEDTLTKLARSYNIDIPEKYIFREIVSGETIEARPEVQRMLSMVHEGTLAGVFVMEIERLARGDTSDQGAVAKAFKYSSTLIITPLKIYDPDNEADEEYLEFGLFMSRREYKTITRRLQSGRLKAVSEGLCLVSAPYGYEKVKIRNDKGYTYQIIPDQANVIRSIFDWYVNGVPDDNGVIKQLGASRIANRLDSLGIKPKYNSTWSKASVTTILRNPTYAGMLRWGYKKEVRYIVNGKIQKHRKRGSRTSCVPGKHPGIISIETYEAAQDIMANRSIAPVPGYDVLKNPFTGLVYCGKCGKMLTRLSKSKKTPYDALKCMNKNCDNISSPLYLVEDVVIQSLQKWLNEFKAQWNIEKISNPYSDMIHSTQSAADQIQSDMTRLLSQRDRLYDLVEQGVYSIDVFTQRNKKLTADIESLELSLEKNKDDLDRLYKQAAYNDVFIPKAEHILSEYFNMDSAAAKNEALKELVNKITYTKNEPNKRGNRENRNFEILIDPKVMRF